MEVSNVLGRVMNCPTRLTLNTSEPAFTAASVSRTIPLGGTVSFSVTSTGAAPNTLRVPSGLLDYRDPDPANGNIQSYRCKHRP